MKKKNQQDAIALLELFQKSVLQKKPDMKGMISEIRMMKFKVKPVQGDFSAVNFNNDEFIEILWSLGKMDEFYQKQFLTLKKNERNTFYTYFDSMHKKLQEDLNRLNLKKTQNVGRPPVLEMEIFKERSRHTKNN